MSVDPVVWFFLPGLAARLLRAYWRIPGAIYAVLSLYLTDCAELRPEKF